jgi:hypothetical protein
MCHAGGAILTQSRVFSIFDQAAVDHLTNVGLFKEVGNSPVSPDKLDKLPGEIETDLKKHASYLTKADTLADLAAKLGLTKLPDTVTRYNALVGTGADTDFGKDKAY